MLVLTTNAVAFWGLVTTQQVDIASWIGSIEGNLRGSLPIALAGVLTGVLNSQLSATAKARIVFLEWTNPLPGSRAFTKYLNRDSRINPAVINSRFGPLPKDPVEQNQKWYSIYLTVQDLAQVADANKNYLFGRDYASLMALAILFLGPLSLALIQSPLTCIGYISILLLQYIVAANAARNHAVRLITNVLAVASKEN
jgi:hypothetical protein